MLSPVCAPLVPRRAHRHTLGAVSFGLLFAGHLWGCAPESGGGGGGADDAAPIDAAPGPTPIDDAGSAPADGDPDSTPTDGGRLGPDGASPVDPDGGGPLRDGGEPDAGISTGAYVRIEPGVFTMGSPIGELGRVPTNETQHEVTLTRAFHLKATEVTQGEWRALMASDPSEFGDCGDDCPVEGVTWSDAVDYANALSDAQGLPRCYDDAYEFAGLDCAGYRLPTEAEWEYAARAGTQTAFYTGDITQIGCDTLDPSLDEAGWYCGNADDATHPVAQKAPNAWGLYDMHGNVWEWVHDWYHREYGDGNRAAVDPIGPPRGRWRAHRGGAWSTTPMQARAARRHENGVTNDLRIGWLGFRLARTAAP